MRGLVMGCTVAALMALTAKSEARIPANREPKSLVAIVPLCHTEVGYASWYGAESEGTTASGETYDLTQLTAAHRTLPLESRVKVTNLRNHRSVILRVNDRGPNVAGRMLDVSEAAAERLGFIDAGETPVRVTVLRYPRGYIASPVLCRMPAVCNELVK